MPATPEIRQLPTESESHSCTGIMEMPGCRVLSLNGSVAAIGNRTSLASGAVVTIESEGVWQYEPPAAAVRMPKDGQAIDYFCCAVDVDGCVTDETITVRLQTRSTGGGVIVTRDTSDSLPDDPPSEPVRILIEAKAQVDTVINLRHVSGHDSDAEPAVLILEMPAHATAAVGETGEIIFRPHDGFAGITEMRCLTENRHRSATFVIVQIDVQPLPATGTHV